VFLTCLITDLYTQVSLLSGLDIVFVVCLLEVKRLPTLELVGEDVVVFLKQKCILQKLVTVMLLRLEINKISFFLVGYFKLIRKSGTLVV
jgi:hypothetical protein